jgi:hypothetical protein
VEAGRRRDVDQSRISILRRVAAGKQKNIADGLDRPPRFDIIVRAISGSTASGTSGAPGSTASNAVRILIRRFPIFIPPAGSE